MTTGSVVDQIVQSLAFEVEAIPQKPSAEITGASHTTPLNVKIRVKKRDEYGMQQGIMSVPKFGQPEAGPARIRLISSDQTIMSFDVSMEADFAKKGKRKPRKSFFGGCLGLQYDDDDSTYLPSNLYSAKTADGNVSSKSDGVLKQNFTFSKMKYHSSEIQSYKRKPDILGKCKPGGCLDPPFGEEKYAYERIQKLKRKITSIDEEAMSAPAKIKLSNRAPDPNASFESKRSNDSVVPKTSKPKTEDNSVLSLYEAKPKSSLDSKYSDLLITYPPDLVSPSTTHTEKYLRNGVTTEAKQRKSFDEPIDAFYSSPRRTSRLSEKSSREEGLPKRARPKRDKMISPTEEDLLSTGGDKTKINKNKLKSTDNAITPDSFDHIDISYSAINNMNGLEIDPQQYTGMVTNTPTPIYEQVQHIGNSHHDLKYENNILIDQTAIDNVNVSKPDTNQIYTTQPHEFADILTENAVQRTESNKSSIENFQINNSNIHQSGENNILKYSEQTEIDNNIAQTENYSVNNNEKYTSDKVFPNELPVNVDITSNASSNLLKYNEQLSPAQSIISKQNARVDNQSLIDSSSVILTKERNKFKDSSEDKLTEKIKTKNNDNTNKYQSPLTKSFADERGLNLFGVPIAKKNTVDEIQKDDDYISGTMSKLGFKDNNLKNETSSVSSPNYKPNMDVKPQLEKVGSKINITMSEFKATGVSEIPSKIDRVGNSLFEKYQRPYLIPGEDFSKSDNVKIISSTDNAQPTIIQNRQHFLDDYLIPAEDVLEDSENQKNNPLESEETSRKYNTSEHNITDNLTTTASIQSLSQYATPKSVMLKNKSTLPLPSSEPQMLSKSSSVKSSKLKFPTSLEPLDRLNEDDIKALRASKRSLKKDAVSLDLAFQSYVNDKKERTLKTVDNSNDVVRFPDDAITVIQSQLRPNVNEIRIPVDSDNEMTIKLKRMRSPTQHVQIVEDKSSIESGKVIHGLQSDHDFLTLSEFNRQGEYNKEFMDKIASSEIHKVLNTVYENELVPLQNTIKNLKDEIDVILAQQSLLVNELCNAMKAKPVRLLRVDPRCSCWRK